MRQRTIYMMSAPCLTTARPRNGWLALKHGICGLALASLVVACSGQDPVQPIANGPTGGTDSSTGGGVTSVSGASVTASATGAGQTTGLLGTTTQGSAVTGEVASVGTGTTGLAVSTTDGSVTGATGTSGAGLTTGAAVGTATTTTTTGVGGATGTATTGVVGTASTTGAGGGTSTDGSVTSTTSAGTTGGAFGVCTGAPAGGAVTIHVIGDSTASIYASSLYPRTGWGQVLGDYYAPACAVVSDKALSGRSSKSFYDEGAWAPVRDALAPGDFVLIQFGHNDEKSDDLTRYTDPQTTFKQYLTTYINDTRAKQATPVLLTPIHRNGWTGTMIKDSHGAYPPAMRELAADLNVDLIDLTLLTQLYFERIGEAATTILFMNLQPGEFPNYPDGNADNTHLRETGARAVAQLANYDAYQQQLPLAALLSAVPVAP